MGSLVLYMMACRSSSRRIEHPRGARGTITRRDFGITFGLAADSKIVIGDKVDITLDVQAVLDA